MNQLAQTAANQVNRDGQTTNQSPSIYEFLYSHYRALEVLQGRGMPNYPIQSVEVIDPDKSSIRIGYLKQGSLETLDLSCMEFVTPFWSTRQNRGRGYTVIPKGLDRVDVQSRTDQKPPHTVVMDEGRLLCTCQDFRNQELAFRQHPYLWAAIEGQPHCKHIFCGEPTLRMLNGLSVPVHS